MAKAPKFGISFSFQAHRASGQPWDTVYREALELAAEASRLGFESIWVSEHHGEEDGYCPSPVVAGAALAAAAPRCRIGQGIAIAPLQGHPLKLAEDLAVLDNLSGGRAEIGFGQGYRPAEYESFGLPYGRRTRALEEALEILKLAWRGERFDYAGDIYRVTAGLLRPPPLRPGVPPRWMGAAARAARERVIRNGAGLIVAPLIELEHAARQLASFEREVEAQGRPPAPTALMREILIGGSVADAMARNRPALDHVYRLQYAPERTKASWVDPASGQKVPLTSDHPYYLSEHFVRERWFVGAPEAIADAISSWQPRLNLDRLLFHPLQPGMALKDAVADLECVAKIVAPRVREKLAAV